MMRSSLLACLLLCLGGGLDGCAGSVRYSRSSLNPNTWANWAEADEPILLDVAGPVGIDIDTFAGEVIIQGNPKLTQAKVTVVREGVHGYGRRDEAEASLKDIHYTAEVVAGGLGQVLQVRATTTNAERHFQRAHVQVEMPDIDGVRVRTTNGRVWVCTVRGRVDIATTEGNVRVMTNLPMNDPITIVNRNGDIDLRMRAESQGKIDAQTVNGRAYGFARYGKLVVGPDTRDDTLHATLNGGANPITLRTVNGDIEVAVVHNPELVDDHPIE